MDGSRVEEASWIGKDVVRIDGQALVRGETRFVGDLEVPGLLHGAIVRAPLASGTVRSLAFDPAFDWSGVTVVRPDDIPGENVIRMIRNDMPCLAGRRIRYLGEPVALVCARDPASARRAAHHVTVEADPLPSLAGIEAIADLYRRSPDALERIHECSVRRGDVEHALGEADTVVEGEYFTGPQEHAYLETQGILALPQGNRGGMRIVGSLQCPYYVRPAVAGVLGVPDDQVVVEQLPTGGAFGGKEDFPSLLASYAALLARKAGRPVRLVLDRTEDISFTTKRHPSWIRHRTGVARDGTLLAMEVRIVLEAGAYTTLSPVVLARSVLHACGAYRCPNVRVEGIAVRSNIVPSGAFRGFGAPQALFALESHIDEIAARLRIDPLELRRRNILRPGDRMATGQLLSESVGGEACLEALAEESRFEERRRAIEREKRASAPRRGIGMAAFLHGASFTGTGEKTLRSRAALRLLPDGTVEILSSMTEMGQGSLTTLAQIVASALSIPIERIRHRLPDTSRVPDSGPTVASRSTMIVGRILETCARELKTRIAAPPGSGPPPIPPGGITVEREYDFPADQIFDEETFTGSAYPCYSWGAVAAEVEVDPRTHAVVPAMLWLCYEVGRAVNPKAVRGQLEGGSIQALGWALYEGIDLGEEGRCLQSRLQTYIVPTAADIPEIRTRILELPYSRGPGGAKGIGEMPMNGVAAAVRNAVRHALGLGIDSLPITPEKIFAALEGGRRGGGS